MLMCEPGTSFLDRIEYEILGWVRVLYRDVYQGTVTVADPFDPDGRIEEDLEETQYLLAFKGAYEDEVHEDDILHAACGYFPVIEWGDDYVIFIGFDGEEQTMECPGGFHLFENAGEDEDYYEGDDGERPECVISARRADMMCPIIRADEERSEWDGDVYAYGDMSEEYPPGMPPTFCELAA